MFIFWVSCGTLAIVPIYFVWNRVYKDGIIGRAALLAISFFAWSFIIEAVQDGGYTLLRQTVALVASFAAFLLWHLYRFHRRVVKRPPVCPPDCPVDRRSLPDRRFLLS